VIPGDASLNSELSFGDTLSVTHKMAMKDPHGTQLEDPLHVNGHSRIALAFACSKSHTPTEKSQNVTALTHLTELIHARILLH
jgi:hypothetical protein